MQIFENAIFALIGFVFLFFLVFFCLCYAWSAMYKRKQRLTIGLVVSSLVSFRILATGFFVLALIYTLIPILLNYIPVLSNIFSR